MQDIPFTVHVFKEGDLFIARARELDVASQGDTEAEAGANILEAVQLFLETVEEKGDLEVVLTESGYTHTAEGWKAPETISVKQTVVSLA